MVSRAKIRKKLSERISKVVDPRNSFFAWLGNKSGTIQADTNGNVYVTDDNGVVHTVLNKTVPNEPRRRVEVGYISKNSKVLQVLRMVEIYPGSRLPLVPEHHKRHEWPAEDTVWVRRQQILHLIALPSDEDPFSIVIFGGEIIVNNITEILQHQVVDLEAYIPASGAIWLLVEVNDDLTLSYTEGDVYGNRELLLPANIPERDNTRYPICAVKLYNGMTRIIQNETHRDIYNFSMGGSGGSGGGTPAGSNGDVQYNNSGSFGGDVNFHYDAATNSLEIGGHVLDLTLLEGMINSITEGESNGRMQFTFSDDITDGSFITFVRAKGTKASPTAVTDGTVIGYVRGRAWQQSGESFGNATDTQISIELVADGDWDVDDNPTRLDIYTTPTGSGTKVLAMTIGSDGNVNIASGKTYNINGTPHTHAYSAITETPTLREVLTTNRTYYVGYNLGTVTMTIASPCVVTKNSHGLENDDPVVFRTTGALPTGITAGTVYYVKNKATNTFEISTSAGGASVNTSGSQSGTHSAHTGNNSNNGLTTGRAGAFLTIQKAVDTVAALDISIYDVIIQLSSGLFVEAVTLEKLVGSGLVTIQGDTTTPANVVVTQAVTNGSTFLNTTVGWKIRGVKVTATGTSGRCISSIGAGASLLIEKIDFGTASVHLFVTNGGYIEIYGDYSITAGADIHWDCINGIIHSGAASGGTNTITLTGTPAFASAFCLSTRVGYVRCNATTFSGSATGVRYSVTANGVIFTNGGGANFLPGNAAGSSATGGQYI